LSAEFIRTKLPKNSTPRKKEVHGQSKRRVRTQEIVKRLKKVYIRGKSEQSHTHLAQNSIFKRKA
jgi:hypothetical protein